MRFLMIVNDPGIARFASASGVDTLFVDLEHLGKHERQGHLESWQTEQTSVDVSKIRAAAPNADLLVRINPLHEGTADELDDVIDRGADSVMLPMFRTYEELARFFELLDGRVKALPLFETMGSLDALPAILHELPLKSLHIGLNDLHLDLGHSFMFEAFSSGVLEAPCAALCAAGVPFGIGGVARAREGIVSPEFLLGEHARLGSSAAILSRTFHRNARSVDELEQQMDFGAELAALRRIYAAFASSTPEEIEENRELTADRINDVVRLIQGRKQ